MSDVLEKIRKLMALALNNPSGDEARCAALKAVELLRDHDVVLSLPAQGPVAPVGLEFDYGELRRAMWRQAAQEQPREPPCRVCHTFHSPRQDCFAARWADFGGER